MMERVVLQHVHARGRGDAEPHSCFVLTMLDVRLLVERNDAQYFQIEGA
jgi:hypothetical protein